MKNFILGGVFVLLVIGVGWFAYQQGRISVTKPSVQPSLAVVNPQATKAIVSPKQPLVGGDKDEYGCIGSAGYSWCELKKKCLRSWEEACDNPEANDSELIKQALIDKHSWKEPVTVTISRNDGQYATGGVKFGNEDVGGGYFFAAKVNGTWEIVADGNGTIMCSSLEKYPDYPASLIPECWDENNNKAIIR